MVGITTKGAIKCPCCRKGKIVAYEGASGKSSIECGKCHAFLLIDYDKMTAELTQGEKGVYKMIANV